MKTLILKNIVVETIWYYSVKALSLMEYGISLLLLKREKKPVTLSVIAFIFTALSG